MITELLVNMKQKTTIRSFQINASTCFAHDNIKSDKQSRHTTVFCLSILCLKLIVKTICFVDSDLLNEH